VSQGFRAPNLSDLTRLDIARSGELETPVTDLDPEQFVALEAGVRSRGARHEAQLVYYHTFIEDMIVRAPTGREIDGLMEVTKKNSGDGYVQGVEASGRFTFAEDWTASIVGTWMYGEVDTYPTSSPVEERDYISRIMPLTAEASLRWDPREGRFWAEALCTAADDADKLSVEDQRDTQRIPPGGTPGYVVATARAGARVTDILDLALALENIFDEDYRIHGSGVNEPGQNLVLTANCDF
jgi:hemoglobin/transferrin/lactoferrin receptor protein